MGVQSVCVVLLVLRGAACGFLEEEEGGPVTKEMVFQLFTRGQHAEEGVTLEMDCELGGDVKREVPWKFLIHGWTTSPAVSPWYRVHRDNYLRRGEHNVVYVDWSVPANQSYVQSVVNARGAGRYLGEFLLHLRRRGVSMGRVHLLGHSLGSHAAGFAGKHVHARTGEKVARITATDPARPLYETPFLLPPSARIASTDAHFVDAVHTDAANYGMVTPVGTADFYPNGGGRYQPGCEDSLDENCSHAKSVQYFGESILRDRYVGTQCDSYKEYLEGKCHGRPRAVFGEGADPNVTGVFYFNTEPPTTTTTTTSQPSPPPVPLDTQ